MMLRIYQVDAFALNLFEGNPAAVCPLKEWLPDEIMQKIAMENNLAETAFFVQTGNQFHIRWFTPMLEVELCGHATLASAHVLFNHMNYPGDEISFMSLSGLLIVKKDDDRLTLNFPADIVHPVEPFPLLKDGLKVSPLETYKGKTDFMAVLGNQKDVESLDPDFKLLAKVEGRGIIVTAPGDTVDFVSRFFAPQSGVDEDPVTGSAHTTLTPFWAERLGKTELTAMQLSKRKGYLWCRHLGERTDISGNAITYLTGEIHI